MPVKVEGPVIPFEAYPNRDSLPFAQTFGYTSARTMNRATFRNQGWCAIVKRAANLGPLSENEGDMTGQTHAQLMAGLIDKKSPRGIKQAVAPKIGASLINFIVAALEWLGQFSSAPLPAGCKSPLDVLIATMLAKMALTPSERDLLVPQQQFVAEFPGRKEKITSTMIDFEIPNGALTMNHATGLPPAVGVRRILEGKIKSRGALVPVLPEIYGPALSQKTVSLG